jgi:putative transposase
MHDLDNDRRQSIGLFRYGLIADLLQLPPGGKGLYEHLAAKAALDYTIPGSRRTRVAAETLRDWLKAYRRGGFEALRPLRACRPRTGPCPACRGGRGPVGGQGGQPQSVGPVGHP